jgi:adenine phosphoribosyltransferase
MRLEDLIRAIPDYPKKGIIFRDITTLLEHPIGFAKAVKELARPLSHQKINQIAGIEARGFILGGAVAYELALGFVTIRKKGKLPWKTLSVEYELEYGRDEVEIHLDSVQEGEQIVIVDDLIATGGTAAAAVELIRRAGGEVAGASFVIDLPELGGRERLESMGVPVHSLIEFAGE